MTVLLPRSVLSIRGRHREYPDRLDVVAFVHADWFPEPDLQAPVAAASFLARFLRDEWEGWTFGAQIIEPWPWVTATES